MNLFLLVSAILPVAIILLYIYTQDKYEKEPLAFLCYNFLLGAVVSVVLTLVISILIFDNIFLLQDKHNIFEQFTKAFIVVAFTEEFSKYIIVRYYAQPKKDFNEPFDGIVYAVMVSMGFAATENILYVVSGGGYQVALIRAFTAVPAHATFAILMGYFMGKAKFSNNRLVLNLTGLLLAVAFHGLYDFFLFIDFIPGLSVGAFASLVIAILLSRKAIQLHQKNSNFKA